MKKPLLLGFFALILSVSSFAETLFVFTGNPVEQQDITNTSVILHGDIATIIAPVSVYAIAYAAAGNDTMWSDTVSGFATPQGMAFSFLIDSLLGGTLHAYNVKAWQQSDTLAAQAVWGDAYTFTTNPDPIRSEPVGSVTVQATSAVIHASGDSIGHLAGWYAEWNTLSGSGFAYVTDTMYVTGMNQVISFATLFGLTPMTDYKYRIRSFPAVSGTVPIFIGTTQYFTTSSLVYAEAGAVTVVNITQDSATVNVGVTLGSSGSADVRFLLYDANQTQLLQQSVWIQANQNGIISYRFGGLDQVFDYSVRALVRDLPSVDTSGWDDFTTLQVLDPIITLDSVDVQSHGGIVYVHVDPNGLWSGSNTHTGIKLWYLGGTPTIQTSSNITGPVQISHGIGNVSGSTVVFWQAWAVNDGDSVSLSGNFTTPAPFAPVQLSLGQSFANITNIFLDNCGYTCAVGDTAELSAVYGTVSGIFTDTMPVGIIYGAGTPDVTLTGLVPNTLYYFKLVAKNSDGIWSSSSIGSRTTLMGTNPSVMVSIADIASDGFNIHVFGESGGYPCMLSAYVYVGDNSAPVWQYTNLPVGSDVFDDTLSVTGLAACTNHRVRVCVDGNPMGSVCPQEYVSTIGCSTSVEELVGVGNPTVVAIDVLGREMFRGPYKEVISQLPTQTPFILRGEDGSVIGKIMKQ